MNKNLLQYIPFPWVFLVKKPGHSWHKWDNRVNDRTYSLLDTAFEAAAREPYDIIVTVNGSYWTVNKPGQPIQRATSHGKGYSVIVLEFDEHWDTIKLRLQLLWIPVPSFVQRIENKYTLFYIVNDIDSRQVNYLHINKYLCSASWAINKPAINAVFNLSSGIFVLTATRDFEEYTSQEIKSTISSKIISKIEQNAKSFSSKHVSDFNFQWVQIPEFIEGTQYSISEDWCLFDKDKIIRWVRYNKNEDKVYSPLVWFFQWWVNQFPVALLGKAFLSHFQQFFKINVENKSTSYSHGDKTLMTTESSTVLVYRSGEKDIAREIFSTPIKIIWRVLQNARSKTWWFSEEKESSFLIETAQSKFYMRVVSSVGDFDKSYNNNGLSFYGMPNDLKIFNDIIQRDDSIPVINIRQSSWFYNTYCLLWSEVVAGEKDSLENVKPAFELNPPKWMQLSVKKYCDLWCEIFTPNIFIVALLQSIACCAMNLWNENNTVFPGLFITGTTGTGKTTLFEIIRTATWFGRKERKFAINNMTPQVLQKEACDNAPLFLEEYTAVTNMKIEGILRNILNRDTGARWGISQNTIFPYASPIIACWEHMPQATSVQNRFINLRIDNADRLWTDTKISIIHNYTCYRDIYKTLLENKENINDLYVEQKSFLISKWVHARAADVWAYVFAMAKLFNVIDQESLHWFMKNHLEEMQISQNNYVSWDMRMLSLISKASMQQKVRWMTFDAWQDKVKYMFVFDDMRFNQNKAEIVSIIHDAKSPSTISYQSSNINMIVDMTSEAEQNMNAYALVDRAKSIVRFTS